MWVMGMQGRGVGGDGGTEVWVCGAAVTLGCVKVWGWGAVGTGMWDGGYGGVEMWVFGDVVT